MGEASCLLSLRISSQDGRSTLPKPPYLSAIRDRLLTVQHKAAGTWPDIETLDKFLDLATRDPLLALTYHGGWIVNHATRLNRSEKALSLLRAAFESELNPLANATNRINQIHHHADGTQVTP